MNAWKTIVTAGALLAFAAPAANATFDRYGPSKTPQKQAVHHKRVAPKLKATASPRVLIIVAPATPTATAPSSEESCTIYGSGCTNQQLCDLWAMNCDLAALDRANAVAATRIDGA